jgi:DNA invertase Pin-like site-specific DNA recombinase
VKTYDALIRVSKMNGRKESAESTMTLDDQDGAIASAIREAKGRRGLTLEALDQSGFTIHRTDAYATILDRVRSGKSDGIAVAYGDRLTRNWRAVGPFYDELENAGAEVIIAGMPGVDYRTPEGRALTGMMAVMSDAQGQTAKARGNRIADATIERGVPNRVPYGYRRNGTYAERELVSKVRDDLDGKALVPDETTAPIVRRIFALRLDGHRWASIVSTLNEAGVPSPRGAHWTHNTVCTIVQNEAYTGIVKLGKRRVEDAHEALVSRSDWQRAQSTRTVTRHGRLVAGLAGGLLECSGCGRPLSIAGYPRTVYGCRRSSSAGPCPRPVYVSKDAADDFVEELIVHVLKRGRATGLVASARELEAARSAFERTKAEREAFVKLASALDPDDFRVGYEERRTREAEAANVYDELLGRASDADALPGDETAWKLLSDEEKRRATRLLIRSVVVAPPLSRSKLASIADRFEVRWASAGDTTSTGR